MLFGASMMDQHRPRQAVKRRVPHWLWQILSGDMSLGLPRFFIPINSKVSHIQVTFWLSPPQRPLAHVALSPPLCLSPISLICFHHHRRLVCCWRISSPLESVFSLDFGKFSIARSFLCCVCDCSLDCFDFACLERKLTYRCLDLGFLSFFAHFYGLFGEEMEVLMSRFEAFWYFLLLRCYHYTHVINLHFSLSSQWCDVRDFSSTIDERIYSTSFHSQVYLDSNY